MSSAYAIYARHSDEVGRNATKTIQLGTDSGDSDYGPNALSDDNPAQFAKIDSTTGAWQFDFLTPQRIDLIALIQHDFMAGCDVKIQGSAAPNWAGSPVSAPEFSASIVIPAWKGAGVTRWPTNAWLDLTEQVGYSAIGYRYWRLLVTANDQNLQIGQVILLPNIRRLSPDIQWEYVHSVDDEQIENRTRKGVATVYADFSPMRRLEGVLRADDALDADLDEHWYDTGARAFTFMFIKDGLVNDPMLVRRLERRRSMTHFFEDVKDQRWSLEEVCRGLRPGT